MTQRGPFRCFCALKYESPLATSIHQQAARIFSRFGFELTKGARTSDPWNTTLDEIKQNIDRAFAVIVETAEMSWWIAFEVFCSLERKVVIPLVPEDLKDNSSAQSFIKMFPNVVSVHYTTYGSQHFDHRLSDAISRLLEGASRWSIAVRQSSLHAYAPPRPTPLVEPRLEAADALRGASQAGESAVLTQKEVFDRWLFAGNVPVRAAVVGAPGAGKTLLLAEFARSIGKGRGIPRTAADIDPLIVFIRATELPGPLDLLGFVRRRVHEWESTVDQIGLFEPFLEAGLMYLLVDGIDEFVVRRRNEVSKLEEQLLALQDKQVNLIVSCRENIWFQQIQWRNQFEAFRILIFDEAQALSLLRDVKKIPPGVLDKGVKEWLRNPMFLRFILDLSKGGERTDFGDSRSELYENWARKTLARSVTGEPDIDPALRFYGDVALALLGERSTRLSLSQVLAFMSQRFSHDRPNMDEILNNQVLRENKETQEITFAHESIYEFFVARSLKDDFVNATVPSTEMTNLSSCVLAHVELDYPQSAVYGFLQELLDKVCDGSFEERARNSISRLTTAHQSWRLIRNLIEYLGMVHCAEEKDEETVFELLAVAQNDNLLPRVRYNALRALERVHRCAPRPYFRRCQPIKVSSGLAAWQKYNENQKITTEALRHGERQKQQQNHRVTEKRRGHGE